VTTTDHTPSRSCYQRGCRLPDCVAINYRYEKGVSYDVTCGRRRQIDSQEVRTHIELLRAENWTRLRITKAAGVSRSTVYSLAAGQPEVRAHIARAILSIRIAPAPSKANIDATGSTRRVRALVVIGHTLRTIAEETGFGHSKIEHLAGGLLEAVDAHTAETIANVYRRLAVKPGSSGQAKAFARKRGWHGPLAWDDIDDPAARPEKAKPYQPVPENGRDSMRMAEIEHLYLLGESPESIAKQLDGNEKYVRDLLGAIRRKRAAQAEKERAAARQRQAEAVAA
jgi:hypothetical protein